MLLQQIKHVEAKLMKTFDFHTDSAWFLDNHVVANYFQKFEQEHENELLNV